MTLQASTELVYLKMEYIILAIKKEVNELVGCGFLTSEEIINIMFGRYCDIFTEKGIIGSTKYIIESISVDKSAPVFEEVVEEEPTPVPSISTNIFLNNNAVSSRPSSPSEDSQDKQKANYKPRKIPEDSLRCCARTCDDECLEHGALKVMRDDPANPYGDRCTFKRILGVNFCRVHVDKQVMGVWGGAYDGKMKKLIDQGRVVKNL